MRRSTTTSGIAVALAALLAMPAALAQTGPGADPATEPAPAAHGMQAVEQLGPRLDDVARDYGISEKRLESLLLTDPTLAVDPDGELLYVDEPAPGEGAGPAPEVDPGPEPAPPTDDAVFELHSLPGASHVIYLDFDGSTTTGTSWNSSSGIDPIVSPPYDLDGSPDSWSATELSRIGLVWAYVAEDFAPFAVDVTTEEPPVADLRRSGAGDARWGVRVVVTDDTWADCGCGGHAYIGSFDDATDEPVFVYNSSLSGVSEASSHEVGHSMNLAHDGKGTSTYYGGHGSGTTSWGPIMGAAYNRSVTQWSRGEYLDATNNGSSANYGNGPDDLAVIASLTNGNGFGLRPDDHGDTTATATPLSGLTPVATGRIGTTADVDVFRFTTGAGPVTVQVDPFLPVKNLDVRAQLLDQGGGVVAVSDGAATLSAGFTQTLPAGTYYVTVEGTGVGDPFAASPTGYTSYASLGQYALSATTLPVPAGSISGTVTDDGSGDPVAGAWVLALDTATGAPVAATADASGAFSAVVGPGTHHVLTLDPSGTHAGEWYDDRALDGDPTPVDAGASGLDIGLAPAGATASVSGVVTDAATGQPLPGVWVAAVGPFPDSAALAGGTQTDASGRYTISGLEAGDHLLAFIDPARDHAVEFHDDAAVPSGATLVPLSPGTTATADAALAPVAAGAPGTAPLTGRVTATGTGAPIEGAWVVALDSTGTVADATVTDAAGDYALAVVPGGYFVEFVDPTATHRGEWNLDHPTQDLGAADQVVVGPTGAVVDADLDPAGPTAALSGTVTGVGGLPVPGAWVVVLDPATGGLVKGAVTGLDGSYTVGGLRTGPVVVAFLDPSGVHALEYHDGAAGFGQADPVALVAGSTTAVSATLDPP
ncbi:MAG: carboxypeptidase regulatory-like domain-containing protein [Acidimicrobiales bacterium]|nr:carboxypeptidase regulatory-like domain-containing protein [Acidimicrobiales bacterium]MCB9371467.1 carboxypeptidase regulatory-like domain-containing protein [Microthrixaceae bacterium]